MREGGGRFRKEGTTLTSRGEFHRFHHQKGTKQRNRKRFTEERESERKWKKEGERNVS
jgi:hypothetical protein